MSFLLPQNPPSPRPVFKSGHLSECCISGFLFFPPPTPVVPLCLFLCVTRRINPMASQAFKEHILPLSYNSSPTPCLLHNSLSFQFLLIQTSFPHKAFLDCLRLPLPLQYSVFPHGVQIDKAMPCLPTTTENTTFIFHIFIKYLGTWPCT